MKLKVIVFQNRNELYAHAAELISQQINKKPSSVLGLASGATMIPFYKLLSDSKINFSKVKTFNLDEYLNAPRNKSLRHFMNKHFFSKSNIRRDNIYFLPTHPENIEKTCRDYENLLRKNKIDLQILGLGVNGHIGFNEPGSSIKSRTRKIKLSQTTKNSNKIHFIYALTEGVSTILKSGKILLLATGEHKAKAVKEMLDSPVNAKCPASFLRRHSDVTILLDEKAASLLKKKN
jgi:glucosamine-6-phosphate deaminase